MEGNDLSALRLEEVGEEIVRFRREQDGLERGRGARVQWQSYGLRTVWIGRREFVTSFQIFPKLAWVKFSTVQVGRCFSS